MKPTGFRSDFCGLCGSPVPNQLRSSSLVWVPAGLLEGGDMLEVGAHLFLGSRASWDQLPSSAMPVVAIAPNDALLEKLESNLHEVRARGGELFVFATPTRASTRARAFA
jgi:hypothetical protein